MVGVEIVVFEVLKKFGFGDWIWMEILRDILLEMIGDFVMDVVWIMMLLLIVFKYMMYWYFIKKMYCKFGDKVEIVYI